MKHMNGSKVVAEGVFVEPVLKPRELIAAMLLQGYLSSGRKETVREAKPISVIQAAVEDADALLAELDKK